VETRHADEHKHGECDSDAFEVAESAHEEAISRQLSA
jgi:hypothetical protein